MAYGIAFRFLRLACTVALVTIWMVVWVLPLQMTIFSKDAVFISVLHVLVAGASPVWLVVVSAAVAVVAVASGLMWTLICAEIWWRAIARIWGIRIKRPPVFWYVIELWQGIHR